MFCSLSANLYSHSLVKTLLNPKKLNEAIEKTSLVSHE
jgi:hypothetical protein